MCTLYHPNQNSPIQKGRERVRWKLYSALQLYLPVLHQILPFLPSLPIFESGSRDYVTRWSTLQWQVHRCVHVISMPMHACRSCRLQFRDRGNIITMRIYVRTNMHSFRNPVHNNVQTQQVGGLGGWNFTNTSKLGDRALFQTSNIIQGLHYRPLHIHVPVYIFI